MKSTSHSERCSAPGTRTTPSSILSDLPLRSTYFPSLFFSLPLLPSLLSYPLSLPPRLSVLLFVIWPSRSFKSASPFPPPCSLSLTPTCFTKLLLYTIPLFCSLTQARKAGADRFWPLNEPSSGSFLRLRCENVTQCSHQ